MTQMILEKSFEHLAISFLALFFAAAFALPVGFSLGKRRKSKRVTLILRAVALIQTIPGLAMIAMIVVAFSTLPIFPVTGKVPGISALILYAIPPILTNTYMGIAQTSSSMREVATGLGMTRKQILYHVEVPSAIPMMIAGIRIAGTWTIGMATLASLIGAGGLGDLIMQGLRSMNLRYLFGGTLPAACMAIIFDSCMTAIERWLSPKVV